MRLISQDSNSNALPADNSIAASDTIEKPSPKNSPSIEKARLIIVVIAALLAILSFVAFITTNDTRTLLETSVLAYPLFKVVDFYFR